jgi:hypothetical protein
LIAAATVISGCALLGFADHAVQQTGCRNPGTPPELRAMLHVGSVALQYVVLEDGTIDPDSDVTTYATDPRLADSAWEVIRSCRYRPAIVNGRAIAQRVHQTVWFDTTAMPPLTPILDPVALAAAHAKSIEVPFRQVRRMRQMASYMTIPVTCGIAAETICLFLGIAFGATRLGWRRPVVLAFVVTTTAVAGFVGLLELDIYETEPTAGAVRIGIVSLVAAALYVGAVAWTFKALAKASLRLQVAGSSLVAILVVPFVLLLSFLAACIVGLGCI